MSMQCLSDEIGLMVVEQLSQVNPRSLLSLCRTSRRFCRLATPCIYRSISIPGNAGWASDDDSVVGKDKYTFCSNIIAFCRHITVENATHWPSFVKLLARMHRLDSIRWRFWRSELAADVSTVLRRFWPDVKIYVENLNIGHRDDSSFVQRTDLNILKSLVGCSIYSMDVCNQYDHPVTMRWLKDVLLSSPKLERLRITLPITPSGRTDFSCDNLGAYDLCVEAGESLMSLTTLVYEARFPMVTENCIIPASFFNWTKIRHLELRGQLMDVFVLAMKDEVTELDTLVLEFFCRCDANDSGLRLIDALISRVRGLKSLTLVNPVDQLPISTIGIHGRTLKRLTIRHPRSGSDPYIVMKNVDPYSSDSITELCHLCPYIASLTLDIMIAWDPKLLPYDILGALARFENLRTLRLYFHFPTKGLVPAAFLPHIRSEKNSSTNIVVPFQKQSRITFQESRNDDGQFPKVCLGWGSSRIRASQYFVCGPSR